MSESKRQLLLISSCNIGNNNKYLQHAEDEIKDLLNINQVKKILYIPYAKKNYEFSTNLLANVFSTWNYELLSIHNTDEPIEAVRSAEAIFVGGGNTFVLLKTLYEKNLIEIIRKRILIDGIPYIGCSAGINVATKSINTTNDMPIVYPSSFNALNLIPFNINPHYNKAKYNNNSNCGSRAGEIRDKRIIEFISYTNLPVLGLRDGNSLKVIGNIVTLCGAGSSKLFTNDFKTIEYLSGSDLSFLVENTPVFNSNDISS